MKKEVASGSTKSIEVEYEKRISRSKKKQSKLCGAMKHAKNILVEREAIVRQKEKQAPLYGLTPNQHRKQPLKAGDFVLVDPDEKHQYCNKGDKPFKMICGVPKEFE